MESENKKLEASQNIVALAKRTSAVLTCPYDCTMRPLGINFPGPGRYDVICARGKQALDHPGNVHFRRVLSQALFEYSKASTKMKKSQILTRIVDGVRALSPNGGFIKKKDGQWFEVG